MANPTTNFGWVMPTSTDLVTDLPADFAIFGQAVDTSMAELKGGTTGQVLSKTSNTDMDFTWVAQDDSNAIQNAIVDAKGDLIAASAADTPARLAVGNNGETLVADSSATTGLRYQGSMPAGKNFAINGGFDIWQRGTTGFSTQLAYTADRWYNTQSNNITGSQGTANPPTGSRYYFVQTCTGASAYYTMAQFVETANASQLWGRTVSFSVKLKRNATFNAEVVLIIDKSATVDAGSGATWTSLGTTTITAAQISTSDWTSFSLLDVAIPNDGTANSIQIRLVYNTNPANGSVLNVAQFQFELGSVATTFTRTGGTIQGELAACRYYFERLLPNAAGNGYSGVGHYYTTTQCYTVQYWEQKRVTPTTTNSNASGFTANSAGVNRTSTATAADQITTWGMDYSITTSAVTLGASAIVGVTGGTYIDVSAEL